MSGKRLKQVSCVATLALAVGTAALATEFTVHWWTLDGGGGLFSTDGRFELSGTIGQPDASATSLVGGNFVLTGGFWRAAGRAIDEHTTTPSGSDEADDQVNEVPEELQDCPTPGASSSYCNADIYPNNGDGVWDTADDGDCVIDVLDLGAMLAYYPMSAGATREQGDVYPVGGGDGVIDVLDLGALLAQYPDDCN